VSSAKIRVTLAGLEFGAEFVPIYLHHPDVERLIICDLDDSRVQHAGDRFDVAAHTTDLDAILRSDAWDAVHLMTPITLHAVHTLAVLEAGKHCACTIPMALEIEDLRQIIAMQRRVRKNDMMMETAVYTRAFLYVKDLYEHGAFGRLIFLRAAHLRDMEGWPDYWRGFPPHKHITHALSSLLALTGARATKVHCFGSGRLREELQRPYNNSIQPGLSTCQVGLDGRPFQRRFGRSSYSPVGGLGRRVL